MRPKKLFSNFSENIRLSSVKIRLLSLGRLNNKILIPCILGALVALSVLVFNSRDDSVANAFSIVARPAPEFTQTSPDAWLGSAPISMSSLRGKVVMLDFWTFDCWNCYRSFPWLNALEEKYRDSGFQVIGIHTPEFEHEKIRRNVEEKIRKFGLKHPSMMDNDFAYWKSMGNRYWPSFYLIDKRGYIRHVFIGETHQDDQRARDVESALKSLLAEKA